ncbi:hypothetical protein ES708_30215 [subsurface metagenome]
MLTPVDKAAYDDMVTNTAFSWRDMMTRLYVNGYKDDHMT